MENLLSVMPLTVSHGLLQHVPIIMQGYAGVTSMLEWIFISSAVAHSVIVSAFGHDSYI